MYNGKETTIHDLDGLYYLGYILANPGKMVSAQELYFARNGQPVDPVSSEPGELSTRSVFINDIDDDPKIIRVLTREVEKAHNNLKIVRQQGNKARIKKREDDYKRITSCRYIFILSPSTGKNHSFQSYCICSPGPLSTRVLTFLDISCSSFNLDMYL